MRRGSILNTSRNNCKLGCQRHDLFLETELLTVTSSIFECTLKLGAMWITEITKTITKHCFEDNHLQPTNYKAEEKTKSPHHSPWNSYQRCATLPKSQPPWNPTETQNFRRGLTSTASSSIPNLRNSSNPSRQKSVRYSLTSTLLWRKTSRHTETRASKGTTSCGTDSELSQRKAVKYSQDHKDLLWTIQRNGSYCKSSAWRKWKGWPKIKPQRWDQLEMGIRQTLELYLGSFFRCLKY